MRTVNETLAEYIRNMRGAPSRYPVVVEPGQHPPCVRGQAGYTEWKNGRPRRYHRQTFRVSVGEGYLASIFPAETMTAALLNQPTIRVAPESIREVQWVKEHEELARVSMARWNALCVHKEWSRSLDPEEDRRLYSDD